MESWKIDIPTLLGSSMRNVRAESSIGNSIERRKELAENTVLCINVPLFVHTVNGHLPFIILGGQPASTSHADQGFGAREKAGREYSGGNASRIRFRYRTCSYRSVLCLAVSP